MLAVRCIRDDTEPPDGVIGKLRLMVASLVGDDDVRRLAQQLDEHWRAAVESGKVETERLRGEWDGQFGTIPDAEYPDVDFEKWEELARRAGIPPERYLDGDWTPGEFLPTIRGYLLQLIDTQRGGPASGDGDEQSAYVPMKDLWPDRFNTAGACSKFLDANSDKVQSHKPSKNRRLVHAGDWFRHWKERDRQQSELLDSDNAQATIADIEARKLEEKNRKKRGK